MSYQKEISATPVTQKSYPILPDTRISRATEYFLNPTFGSEQNKNGSIVNLEYSWSPAPSLGSILMKGFKTILIADNVTDFLDYGSRPPLVNGLLLRSITNEGTFDYATIKSNADFAQFTNSGAANAITLNGNNTQSGYSLILDFNTPLLVDSSITFQIIVRDDLSSLTYQKTTVFYEILN